MNKLKLTYSKLLLSLLICLSFTSCTSLLISLVTKKDVSKDVKVYENDNRSKIVYIPMVHLGKKGYYESVKKIVDSLRAAKFVVLYEGVDTKTSNDTTFRKFRKVAGYHFTIANDTNNKSTSKAFKNKKYELQGTTNIGIIHGTDVVVDKNLKDLIAEYETQKKVILLDDYDFETPLNGKYKIKDSRLHNDYFLINRLRDNNIEIVLNKYQNQNTVLLYGIGHKFMIHAGIVDNGYRLIKGKLY